MISDFYVIYLLFKFSDFRVGNKPLKLKCQSWNGICSDYAI